MKHWYWLTCPVCCKSFKMLSTKKEIKEYGMDYCPKCHCKRKIEPANE